MWVGNKRTGPSGNKDQRNDVLFRCLDTNSGLPLWSLRYNEVGRYIITCFLNVCNHPLAFTPAACTVKECTMRWGLNEPCCDCEVNVSSFQPETFATRMWPWDIEKINMEAEGGGWRWGVKREGCYRRWKTKWQQQKEERKERKVEEDDGKRWSREEVHFDRR